MLSIRNTSTDPYFNIAAEKYLLKSGCEDVFMMWRNRPSVIIGKHQDTAAEVDMDFAGRNGIEIARRMTGGGAVYNDLGNVNLTFIARNGDYDFEKYPRMLIGFLETIGVQAQPDGRLGLAIDGLKISGSAQYVYKKTTLFHASLLFSTDLITLKTVLNGADDEKRRYVRSVKSPVTNIGLHMPGAMTTDDFMQAIFNHFAGIGYRFDDKDIAEIEQLKNIKL